MVGSLDLDDGSRVPSNPRGSVTVSDLSPCSQGFLILLHMTFLKASPTVNSPFLPAQPRGSLAC